MMCHCNVIIMSSISVLKCVDWQLSGSTSHPSVYSAENSLFLTELLAAASCPWMSWLWVSLIQYSSPWTALFCCLSDSLFDVDGVFFYHYYHYFLPLLSTTTNAFVTFIQSHQCCCELLCGKGCPARGLWSLCIREHQPMWKLMYRGL